jgi:non-heme chloroperoxidase
MLRRDLLKSAVFLSGASGASRSSASRQQSGLLTSPAASMTRQSFIEMRDGTRLFYREWGTGSPVVFVAPWALNADWFEYQMTPLSGQGLRCIAYDRRGHGRSDEPGRGYDFDTLSDDLATVIQRLDLRAITLVGHSMGAGEVVRYLARHKADRVARVALIAPITPFTLKTADNPTGVEQSALEKGRAALSLDRPGQIARAAPAFFGPDNGVSAAMMQWWTDMMVQRCSLKVMLDLHRLFTETDFRPDLRTIALPTLIVHGDKDTSTVLDRTGRATAGLISGSRLVVYEGAAHGLPITHMDRLNQDLLAFAKSSSDQTRV